jgi:hypothetical protein
VRHSAHGQLGSSLAKGPAANNPAMPNPTPPSISGNELITECARRIEQLKNDTKSIEQRQVQIGELKDRTVTTQAEIDAMTAAIKAGKSWTPPQPA